MSSDRVAATVARKELRLFFASPAAWLFLASFAAANGFIVFWVESFFARNIADIRPPLRMDADIADFSLCSTDYACLE